ncbi:MAG TPA: 2-oxoacid:ferredoxin oxidoreductase subunit alpha [Nitrososphaeraceae archaeon]|nr:2-oxoacid:ferredoxin oxidoreductase subunit alpha [Nitrososphaeraceae archaeon]
MSFWTNVNSISWLIGGPQGSGVDSAANIFAKTCAKEGFHIFGKREFYSNIKGEHSYFTIRISDKPVNSHLEEVNVLVSFDAETVFRHADKVSEGGMIIYDSSLSETVLEEVPTIDFEASNRIRKLLQDSGQSINLNGMVEFAKSRGCMVYGLPYFEMLETVAKNMNDPKLSKISRVVNVIAISASISLLGFKNDMLISAIQEVFGSKPKLLASNIEAAKYAHAYIGTKYDAKNIKYKITPKDALKDYLLLSGSQAAAIGKILGGCRFQTYYPITPASDESEFLESNQIIDQVDGKNGSIVVVQTEDEIAAITMAIGASLTGVRTATATSGPGFSLMAEALGWAGMNEVPLVVTMYQRAGPSTGLPTRHEQSDLLFAINAGHGEFPKIVLASGDIEESFYDAIKAFNFAEIFQLPVIHLLDKAISSSIQTCKRFSNNLNIERGDFKNSIGRNQSEGAAGHFQRFKLDDSPISTRVPIGTENAIFWNTGDEHTEEGHISEDPENRNKMMDKRMKKLNLALEKINQDDMVVCHDFDSDGKNVIVSWGSTKGAILEALEKLSEEGNKMKFIQVRLLYPFPTETVKKFLKDAKLVIDVEMNYTSQLGSLVQQNTGREIDYKIVKYNGRPMSTTEIYIALKAILSGNNERRIVLDGGT